MKNIVIIALLIVMICLAACGEKETNETSTDAASVTSNQTVPTDATEEKEVKDLMLKIADTEVTVEWENNESVEALKQLVKDSPITIEMSMYGGFEQVGSIGSTLPTNDVQMKTHSGDIVLYQGNQLVIFYGSNSWSYTKLGKVANLSDKELKDLLSNGNVTVTLYEH